MGKSTLSTIATLCTAFVTFIVTAGCSRSPGSSAALDAVSALSSFAGGLLATVNSARAEDPNFTQKLTTVGSFSLADLKIQAAAGLTDKPFQLGDATFSDLKSRYAAIEAGGGFAQLGKTSLLAEVQAAHLSTSDISLVEVETAVTAATKVLQGKEVTGAAESASLSKMVIFLAAAEPAKIVAGAALIDPVTLVTGGAAAAWGAYRFFKDGLHNAEEIYEDGKWVYKGAQALAKEAKKGSDLPPRTDTINAMNDHWHGTSPSTTPAASTAPAAGESIGEDTMAY